jgi:hypothetical protein
MATDTKRGRKYDGRSRPSNEAYKNGWNEIFLNQVMFVGPDIKEHRIQPSMSVCLKGKREATRQSKKNIDYKCIKSKAQLETNIDGSQSIKALILE